MDAYCPEPPRRPRPRILPRVRPPVIPIGTELVIRRVDEPATLLRYRFDPGMLPRDEAVYLAQASRPVELLMDQDQSRVLARDLARAMTRHGLVYRDKRGPGVVVDPAYIPLVHLLLYSSGVKNYPDWWCDGGTPGKYGNGQELCTSPGIEMYSNDRRAVGLGTWGLGSPGDLGAIADTAGYNVGGSLASSISVVKRDRSLSDATIMVNFVSKVNDTIQSVLVLSPTDPDRECVGCSSEDPAPQDYCASGYAPCSIYLPLWGFGVSQGIVDGGAYTISIRFYLPS